MRRAHRNPANVPRLEFKPPPTVDRSMVGDYYAEMDAWREGAKREHERLKDEYFAILGQTVRNMVARTYQARGLGLFEPPTTPVQAGQLPQYMAAQLRDVLAALLIVNIIHANLYVPDARIRSTRGKHKFEGYQAELEGQASLFDTYFEARATFERRRERFEAQHGYGTGREDAVRYVGREPPGGGARTGGVQQAEAALGGALNDLQGRAAARNIKGMSSVLGRATRALMEMALALGWIDIAPLLASMNLTKLRGEVTRMRRLAERGEPPPRADLEQLEQAAAEDDLSPEGERTLRRGRRVATAAAARAVRAAADHARHLADIYGATREEVRVLDYHNGVTLTWSHPDPINPQFEQRETLAMHGSHSQFGVGGTIEYRVVTFASPTKYRTARMIRRADGFARYAIDRSGAGSLNDEHARATGPNEAGVHAARAFVIARMAMMFRRALGVWNATERGEAQPPPGPFQNPRRRR